MNNTPRTPVPARLSRHALLLPVLPVFLPLLALSACGGQIMPGESPTPSPMEPVKETQPGKTPPKPTPPRPDEPPKPEPPRAACNPTAEPAGRPLLKLTTVEYRNTVKDLLTASGVGMVAAEVKDLLASVPEDSTNGFRGHDNRISLQHVLGYYNVAAAVAEGVAGKPERLAAAAGPCAAMTPLPMSCLDDFLGKFGKRAMRRPLAADEIAAYRKLNDGRPGAEVFRGAILQLLSAPAFLYHVEVEGTPDKGTMLQLSPYEVASRLSYTFWQTLPDDALLAAAADGSLGSDAGIGKQVDRLWADPRTKNTIWQFWNEWLRLESFVGFASSRPAFKSLAMGEEINKPNKNHYADMVAEVRALTELFTFGRKGTMSDLLTTDLSVTKSPDLAKLYGVTPWDGVGEYPRMPAGQRTGLLQRGALLVSPLEQTNPFHRGALIRRTLLCDPLPQPDPTALPPGALDPPPVSGAETTRQRFNKKTADNALCAGCHGSFNDLGFVMEAYDALGRYRTVEKVYDEKDGKLLGELPIDLKAVPRVVGDDTRPVNGPTELNSRIAESKKVERCVASSYFSYVYRRAEADDGSDACVVEEIEKALGSGTLGLEQAWKRIALNAAFRRKKVTP